MVLVGSHYGEVNLHDLEGYVPKHPASRSSDAAEVLSLGSLLSFDNDQDCHLSLGRRLKIQSSHVSNLALPCMGLGIASFQSSKLTSALMRDTLI